MFTQIYFYQLISFKYRCYHLFTNQFVRNLVDLTCLSWLIYLIWVIYLNTLNLLVISISRQSCWYQRFIWFSFFFRLNLNSCLLINFTLISNWICRYEKVVPLKACLVDSFICRKSIYFLLWIDACFTSNLDLKNWN